MEPAIGNQERVPTGFLFVENAAYVNSSFTNKVATEFYDDFRFG